MLLFFVRFCLYNLIQVRERETTPLSPGRRLITRTCVLVLLLMLLAAAVAAAAAQSHTWNFNIDS